MKIAVISDIHGNLEALNSVMEDIEQRECDKIFVLGDLAMAGPNPDIAVDYFMSKINDPKYTIIQGNTDLMIFEYNENLYNILKTKAPIMAEALKSDVAMLSPIQKNFLAVLPIQKELEVDGVKFLLVHGSPRKNNEDILPDLSLEKVEEMLEHVETDVVLCGHTHIPCGFQTSTKKTVVNVGSVGRPFYTPALEGEDPSKVKPKACYLTIDVDNAQCTYQHHFIDYDRDKASQELAKRNFDGANKLAEMLLNPETRHF